MGRFSLAARWSLSRKSHTQREARRTRGRSPRAASATPALRAAAAAKPATGDALATTERPVQRIGRALAVVPSARPSHKAWRKLGFALTDAFEFMGCTAFDLVLSGCGVRFLALPRRPQANPLTEAISEQQLEKGAGLLGWTWMCQSVYRSREIVEARSGEDFVAVAPGRKTVVVPRKATPGATTLLEPLVHEEVPPHPNRVSGLDHIVVAVNDAGAAADAYEQAFALNARRTEMQERSYAFIKVGEFGGSVIELVGPVRPGAGALGGHGWGMAFRTPDLDATVRYLADAGVHVGDPHPAVQGGRIASLPIQIGGIHIAFVGE
jgi:predicted enzyme related to lactoylglutathione lyase